MLKPSFMKIELTRLSTVFAMIFLLHPAFGQHQIKSIVKKNMASLEPYQYDAYAMKEISYGPKAQNLVIEFSVYSDEEYKLVFCKTVLPQEVEINIYDKGPKNKTRKLIYFDESGKKDQYSCTFKPTTSGQYFIEYKVPAATAPDQKGTMIVLIGIKDVEPVAQK